MADEGQSRLRYLFMRVPTGSAWTASRRNVSTFYQHDTSRAEIRNVPAYLDKFHRPHARRLNSTGDAACRHRQEGALLLRRLGGHLLPSHSLRRFCSGGSEVIWIFACNSMQVASQFQSVRRPTQTKVPTLLEKFCRP